MTVVSEVSSATVFVNGNVTYKQHIATTFLRKSLQVHTVILYHKPVLMSSIQLQNSGGFFR